MHSAGRSTDIKALEAKLLQMRKDASYYRRLSDKYK